MTTEDKIVAEVQSKGTFKARPFNKRLFQQTEAVIDQKEKLEPTKFAEFELSVTKRSKWAAQEANPETAFKALPFNKNIFKEPSADFAERKSAPPKIITHPKEFKLSTRERS